MLLSLLTIAAAQAADPCQERLLSLQIADQGAVEAVVSIGGRSRALTLQHTEPLMGHGVRGTGRYADVHAAAGHHADGTAWLKVYRGSAPILAVNEHMLATDWTGNAALLQGAEPVVTALVFAVSERVGGQAEVLGAAARDWMYETCRGDGMASL